MNQAIQGKNKLLEWYSIHKEFPFFYIYLSHERDRIIHSSPRVEEEAYTFDRGLYDLENALSFLTENCVYGIRLQKKYIINHKNDVREQYYKHFDDSIKPKPAESPQTVLGISGIGNADLVKQIETRSNELFEMRYLRDKLTALEIENQKLKAELEHSIGKVKEFEEQIDGRRFATEIYQDLKPILPEALGWIKSVMSQQNSGVNGLPKPVKKIIKVNTMAQNTTETNEQLRLENAMREWFGRDSDALLVIEKIVETCRDKPADYNLYKSMLLK